MADKSGDADFLGPLNTLCQVGVVGDLSDGQLLRRFAAAAPGGGAEEAFAALVGRHGPMVFRVCRQVLGDTHDAEDAFQATFLRLARKAGAVRQGDSVAGWLHRVARRVALRAKDDAARRRARESERRNAPTAGAEPVVEEEASGRWPEVHEEVARLPEAYRAVVVLCYLEGLTTGEAARRLGCPQGTVLSRLSRARERLRGRLARRGLAAPAGLFNLGRGAADAVPSALAKATVRAATRAAAGGVVSGLVGGFCTGGMDSMISGKLKLGLYALFTTAAMALGTGLVVAQFADGKGPGAGRPPGNAAEKAPDDPPPAAKAAAVGPKKADDWRVNIPGFPEYSERLTREQLERLSALSGGVGRKQISATVFNSLVVVHSPDGSMINVLRADGNQGWQSYRIPLGVKVHDLTTNHLVALGFSGPDVRELAVFSRYHGYWVRHLLDPPVSGEVVPEVSDNVAWYRIGNVVHAFSSGGGRWDTLRLPDPENTLVQMNQGVLMAQSGETLFVFSTVTGKWSEGVDCRPVSR